MGFIARLDGATLRMKWKRVIPRFNVGQGLLDGAFAYVTGIGFVGKVNLSPVLTRGGTWISMAKPTPHSMLLRFRRLWEM